jgi:hypothetical protein
LTFDRKGVELVVIYWDVGVLGVFEAPPLIVTLDRLSRDLVNQLLAQAVAGLLVDLSEGHLLSR